MHIHIDEIPDGIIQQYNISPLLNNYYFLMDMFKDIYGLPQEGIFNNKNFPIILGIMDTIHEITRDAYGYIPTDQSILSFY